MHDQIPEIAKILGGKAIFGKRLPDSLDSLRHLISEGMPNETVGHFARWTEANETEVVGRLGFPLRTWLRWKEQHKPLSPAVADNLVRHARLFEYAVEVFGGKDDAIDWMKTPNPTLSGEAPWSLLSTDLGAKEVELLLGRIEHGVFS